DVASTWQRLRVAGARQVVSGACANLRLVLRTARPACQFHGVSMPLLSRFLLLAVLAAGAGPAMAAESDDALVKLCQGELATRLGGTAHGETFIVAKDVEHQRRARLCPPRSRLGRRSSDRRHLHLPRRPAIRREAVSLIGRARSAARSGSAPQHIRRRRAAELPRPAFRPKDRARKTRNEGAMA